MLGDKIDHAYEIIYCKIRMWRVHRVYMNITIPRYFRINLAGVKDAVKWYFSFNGISITEEPQLAINLMSGVAFALSRISVAELNLQLQNPVAKNYADGTTRKGLVIHEQTLACIGKYIETNNTSVELKIRFYADRNRPALSLSKHLPAYLTPELKRVIDDVVYSSYAQEIMDFLKDDTINVFIYRALEVINISTLKAVLEEFIVNLRGGDLTKFITPDLEQTAALGQMDIYNLDHGMMAYLVATEDYAIMHALKAEMSGLENLEQLYLSKRNYASSYSSASYDDVNPFVFAEEVDDLNSFASLSKRYR